MRDKTIKALMELGMPTDIRGFHYIVDAMNIYSEDESYIYSKAIDLYEKIAKKYNTSSQSVDRNIKHAFSTVYENESNPAIDKYLTKQRITNGNLLGTLYLKLTMNDSPNKDWNLND